MFKPFTINIRGKLFLIDRPQVMGIINVTPDSFHSASRASGLDEVRRMADRMVTSGADMIDIGGCSTRPGSEAVELNVELERISLGLRAIREVAPEIPVSVDTFRATVAREAICSLGADMINDVTGGDYDPEMFSTVADLHAPYILTHSRGDSVTMQSLTDYEDVTAEVISSLSRRLRELRLLGVSDVIVDPGFGFAKTLDQNYALMRNLNAFGRLLDAPLLVGVSRKSMITKMLNIPTSEALNGTTVLNTIALMRGASILRVHDTVCASQAVRLYMKSTYTTQTV
ncbi:MAG: dihydropteroate synthase [Muribaculaceae bacterium]|nr:dihydropteroate synthase [Muribaculaceae bacterium]